MKTIIVVILVSISTILADGMRETRKLSLDADDIKMLDIASGSGFLKINGDENSSQIEVVAEIEIDADDENELKKILERSMDLSLEKQGSKAKLESNFDQSSSFWRQLFSGGMSAKIDLTVTVPKSIELRIDEGSGFTEISGINGDVKIDDGSGNLDIEKINGNVSVDDGSGNVNLRNIKGSVRVDDGSGTVIIEDVMEDCYLDDGSGSADISNIGGDVEIDDGSGSVRITKVSGDVVIKDDGSGSVSISDVDGQIYRHDLD